MKSFIRTTLLCFLVIGIALLISSAIPIETPEPELKVAKIYPAKIPLW